MNAVGFDTLDHIEWRRKTKLLGFISQTRSLLGVKSVKSSSLRH